MKNLFLLVLGIISIVVSCTKVENRSSSVSALPDVSNAFYVNKFGAISNKGYANATPSTWGSMSPISEDHIHSVTEAKDLGVAYYRMAIIQSQWNASGSQAYKDSSIKEFVTAAVTNSLKVILNLNNEVNPMTGNKDFPTGSALTTYKAFVQTVLDSCNAHGKYPYMVVVENEEDNDQVFNITTRAQCLAYANEIAAVKTICDPLSIICSNGGLIGKRMCQAAYYNAVVAHPLSLNSLKAWAYSVLPTNFYLGLIDTTAQSGYTFSSATISQQISIDDTLMHFYDSVDHLTYINLHWYEPSRAAFWNENWNNNQTPYTSLFGRPATNPDAVVPGGISPVIQLINLKFSSPTIFSNEVGQVNISPCLATSLCGLINTNFTIGVLYDGDGSANFDYTAKSYYSNLSATTYSRRTTGDAVHTWITSGTAISQCP